MVTPIESNLSIFNVDHMANQVKDPNASHAMGAQQIDVKKESEQLSQKVQAPEETDTFIKISEREKQREGREDEDEPKKKKKQAAQPEHTERTPETSRGFSFIG